MFEIFNTGCKLISNFFNFEPSWKSIHNWLLKYGLYKLTRIKEKADDWIFFVDFKVQAGCQKCCLVLGARLSDLLIKKKARGNFCLTHEDVEVLGIELMEKSCGEHVFEILEKITMETGPAMQIIADHGADVNKGIRIYNSHHNKTVNTYDITHKLACLLKKELDNDDEWQGIVTQINDTKQKTKQSTEACLAPPRMADKARYMNIDIQVDWLEEIIILLSSEYPDYLDKERLEKKVGWVLVHSDAILEYVEIKTIIQKTRNLIRNEGLHWKSYIDLFKLLKAVFSDTGLCVRALRFAKSTIKFLKAEGRAIPREKTLLGSSEIIESIFGKYKQVEERIKATKSITPCILTIGAIVGKQTSEDVLKALQTITMKKIYEWKEQWIGKSDLCKRREVFQNCFWG